jgi:hypothetical protein
MEIYFKKIFQFISFLLLLTISLIHFKQDIEMKMEEYAKSYLSADQQNSSGIRMASKTGKLTLTT